MSKLSANDKVRYYNGYCERMGLDPYTKPFDLLRLNGREVLYCTRSGTQQLNKLHKVSHTISSRETNAEAGVYIVTAKASLPDNRCTESIGAVNIAGLKGEAYANAIMKAETKAKRRATLDLLGLGVLDESEAESIPNATTVAIQTMVEALPQMEVESVEVIEETEEEKELSIGRLAIAIKKASNIVELKAVYDANKHKIETNQFIKEQLKARKNELISSK
ncbi:MAG: hypothetical protein ACRCW1_00070 [Anaerotignaceae bacterium]